MSAISRLDPAALQALLEQMGLTRGMTPKGARGPDMAMMGKGGAGMMMSPALMAAAERRQGMTEDMGEKSEPDDSEEGKLLEKLAAWWGGSGEENESRDVAEELNKKLPGNFGARRGLKKNRARRKAAEDASKE